MISNFGFDKVVLVSSLVWCCYGSKFVDVIYMCNWYPNCPWHRYSINNHWIFIQDVFTEAVIWSCSVEISRNSQESKCVRVSFLIKLQKVCNFIKKETLTQVFSCKFCEISKNTFFNRTPSGCCFYFYNCLLYIQRRIQNPVKHLRWSVLRK